MKLHARQLDDQDRQTKIRDAALTNVTKVAALKSRAPYPARMLRRLIAPGSVALVGASPTTGSFGNWSLRSLTKAGFQGRIFLINQKYKEIDGQVCYASLAELPEPPDCVVIAVQRQYVAELVREAAAAGAGGIIIYASGYTETGLPERREQQEELSLLAEKYGIPIIGPNCIGIANGPARFVAAMVDVPELSTESCGGIGIVSQSGAFGLGLAQASHLGAPISHILTAGNCSDVDIADQVAYLAEDPSCQVVACLFEGSPDPKRLIQAARLVREAGKPFLVCKIAAGLSGAEAALSHTGSLAGSHAAYKSEFERIGAIWIEDPEALLEAAAFFGKAGQPKASGVAVLSSSGGAAILSADKAELHGVALPQPRDSAREILMREIPEFGSARNPCDVTAQAAQNPNSIIACAEAMFADPQYGTVILCVAYAHPLITPRLEAFAKIAKAHNKIGIVVWVSNWLEGPGASLVESSPHLALFRSMDRCFAMLSQWTRPVRQNSSSFGVARAPSPDAQAWVRQQLLNAQGHILSEGPAKAIFKAYGIPVVEEVVVNSLAEARQATIKLGFPLVLKVDSPDIPHKTEAGVVALNVNSEFFDDEYQRIMRNAQKIQPPPDIAGVLVQTQVKRGVELMVGVKVDPLFGPMVVIGLGGVMVELLKDTALCVAPVHKEDAIRMFSSLRGAALLHGFRGGSTVDIETLAEIVSKISRLAEDHQDLIEEIDVNPLICNGERIVAVDALIILKRSQNL